MQPLDKEAGKEKEQGINCQCYKMNFTLVGDIVLVGTRDDKIIAHSLPGHLFILYTYQNRPHTACTAQMLTDLQCVITIRIRAGSLLCVGSSLLTRQADRQAERCQEGIFSSKMWLYQGAYLPRNVVSVINDEEFYLDK